jgi:hypothetical protein
MAFFGLAVVGGGAPSISFAGDPEGHVVGAAELQAGIDHQADRSAADRQAIESLLERSDVRQIAGAAGLDLARARAAAAVLSGPELERLAAQARAVEVGLVGGNGTVVISSTVIIIVLLVLILVAV